MLDPEMTVINSVGFPEVLSAGSTIDLSNASGQTTLSVAATTNFDDTDYAKGWRIIIGHGTAREEEATVATVNEGTDLVLDDNLTFNHTVDADTTVDVESDPDGDNKILKVTATTNFLAGETVTVDTGEADECTYIIASVQAGDSLTMTTVLQRTHAATEVVNQIGTTDVVQVLWAGLSEVINKKHYKRIVLFIPANWTTAALSYLGCPDPDGTFLQVMGATGVAELTSAGVVASRCIVMDGIHMEGLGVIPYLKIRSGVAGTEVDQYTKGVRIRYALMR